jgi:hypothetical protein
MSPYPDFKGLNRSIQRLCDKTSRNIRKAIGKVINIPLPTAAYFSLYLYMKSPQPAIKIPLTINGSTFRIGSDRIFPKKRIPVVILIPIQLQFLYSFFCAGSDRSFFKCKSKVDKNSFFNSIF